jgi:regulator of protease activity HflC (stomatin/prohibitin superfamily)
MKVLDERPVTAERPAKTVCGLPVFMLNLATCVAVPFILVDGIRMAEWPSVIGGVVVLFIMFMIWRGFITVGPNESCVVTSWGEYRGTIREPGFYWVSPFAQKALVTLRDRSLDIDRLRIHDKHGAPIEMAAVVVWRVNETARAAFDVQNVDDFVRHQCESAVRHMASSMAEPMDKSPAVLRRGVGQLQEHLRNELQERVTRAGAVIDEVRLTQRCENWSPVRSVTVSEA